MKLKITTWNINSVRLRIGQVGAFLRDHAPDVLCLQETKCRDSEFPAAEIRKFGYEHIAINGQKGYHGVAIISRLPLLNVDRRDFCQVGDARHISASVAFADQAIRIDNLYVPAGGDEPDPGKNPKFAHKLAFLDEMFHRFDDSFTKTPSILVGDLNVAPHENDVWSHKALLQVVSHTPIETDKLKSILARGSWIDALRQYVPLDQKLYTWWSYRSPDWSKADKGRRLDHIWTSPAMAPNLEGIDILREARGWERPSDHVPVSLRLNF
ncbi:exodeoxyribonuclease III [Rhodoblastus sp.]|uniref:exodeoxyribonuclease III n=1 Tax=Rhodoblastus sp. TaxID=1962975 RepID=UPI0035B41634